MILVFCDDETKAQKSSLLVWVRVPNVQPGSAALPVNDNTLIPTSQLANIGWLP